MTLRYGKTPWITSSYIPTLAGKLFFMNELAGPLVAAAAAVNGVVSMPLPVAEK